MEIQDTPYTADPCSCAAKLTLSTEQKAQPGTKLQFSLTIPKDQHIDVLVKVRDFLTSQGLTIAAFESYRY